MFSQPDQQSESTREALLLETFDAVRDALMACDTETLRDLYAKDYRGQTIRGDVEGRDLVLQFFQPGGVELEMFDTSDLDVQIVGAIGIITGRGHLRGRYQKHEFEHRVRFLDIYIERHQKWLYWISQATEIAAPEHM